MRALLVALMLVGCERVPEPLDFRRAPWSDGEECEYADATGSSPMHAAVARGPAGWTIQLNSTREPSGWELRAEVTDRVEPYHVAHTSSEQQTTEASYEERHIRFSSGSRIERPIDAIEQMSFYHSMRALPFRDGYERELTLVDVRNARTLPIHARVTARERIVVPAGSFDAWRVETPELALRSWYSVEPPHLYLKREIPGSVQLLYRYRASHEAEWIGRPPPAPSEIGAPEPDYLMLALALAVQFPLMSFLPLVIGFVLRRRLGTGWILFLAGALTFLASQIVHLPLNFGLGLLGPPRFVGLWPRPELAAAAGLSAGLCEEIARYVLMRWILKKGEHRGWAPAVQIGAGHGGFESIVVGFLAFLGFINVAAMTFFPDLLADVPEDQRAAALAGVRAYWGEPAYMTVVAGLERVFAMSFHVGASVLVMRAVTTRNIAWLALAILLHAAMDALVPFIPDLGLPISYAILGAWAVVMIAIVVRMREPLPAAR